MSRPRSAHETRARRRQLLTYALCGGAFVLLVNALVGDNGYLATWRASREYASILESIERVRSENLRLEQQIQGINEDPAALEEAARRKLNLIRPGETLVIIKDAKPAPAAPAVK